MANANTSNTSGAKKPGRKPRRVLGRNLVKLPLADLNIDFSLYQRHVLEAHVNNICAHWDERLFTPPVVGRRLDGTYWVLDGQQRIRAAIKMGYEDVLVTLIQPRTKREEAALFTKMNQNTRKLLPRDLHKANVAAGEPISMAIEEVLSKYNFTAKPAGRERMVTALVKMRGAWGAGGSRDGNLLTAQQFQEGKDVLEWAIAAGSPMIASGENASTIYNDANISALIWIRRNALSVPDLDEVKAALTGVNPKWLRTELADTNISGGSVVGRWGTRLGLFTNERNQKETVELPPEAVSRLNAWVSDFKTKN